MSYSFSITKASAVVLDHALQPADVVVAKADAFPLLDHYAVYMGRDAEGIDWFIANLKENVPWLSEWDMESMSGFRFSRLRRFHGNDAQRQAALDRAEQALDMDCRLMHFNCEHFAHWVQKGKANSQQVALGGGAVAVGGLAMAAKSKNEVVQGIGIVLAFLGGLFALKEL